MIFLLSLYQVCNATPYCQWVDNFGCELVIGVHTVKHTREEMLQRLDPTMVARVDQVPGEIRTQIVPISCTNTLVQINRSALVVAVGPSDGRVRLDQVRFKSWPGNQTHLRLFLRILARPDPILINRSTIGTYLAGSDLIRF